MTSPLDVLQAAHRPIAPPKDPHQHVLLVGAVGELGEAVQNRLLADARCARLTVAAMQAIASTDPKLKVCVSPHARAIDSAEITTNEHLVIVVGGRANRRQTAYLACATEDVLPLVQRAIAANVKRLLVIEPLSAWLQLAPVMGDLELLLNGASLQSTVVIRPSAKRDQHNNAPFFERIAQALIGTVSDYFTPTTYVPLVSKTVADAAVTLAFETQGFRVMDARLLTEWLKERKPALAPLRRGL